MTAEHDGRITSLDADGETAEHLRLRELGPDSTRHFLLQVGDNIVGSGRSCSCRLEDRGISRRHAVLHVARGGCTVRDLGSKNGTRVNDELIDERVLKIGDEVAFGATLWTLGTVSGEDVELAIEIEAPTGHGGATSMHEETLPVAEPSNALPRGVVLPDGIVEGRSPAMAGLYEQLAALRRGDAAVLVTGETGVGKEHIARAVHLGSPRRSGPFVAVNCAAMPTELLEAELFGVGRGVATGVSPRPGKIRESAGGTLFLDEIGELEKPLQAKLLRVLQEKEVAPLGEQAQSVDVRFVAATNADLGLQIEEGHFRADLYYRLAGYTLEIPPLRDRGADLPLLVGHFIHQSNREAGKRIRGLTVKAMHGLREHPWPGNIRELHNEIRRLVYQCPDGQAIDSSMLGDADCHGLGPIERLADRLELGAHPLADFLETLERRLVERALQQTGGNRSATARLLGISRNGLTLRLERLGLEA